MNYRKNYIRVLLILLTSWLTGVTLHAQTPVYYVDSTCQMFLALDDSSGNPLSTSPPYLFGIQGRTFSNTNVATANFDFSSMPDGSYPYYVVDGNQNYYRDTLLLACGNINNSPFITDSTFNVSNCGSGACNGFMALEVQNIGIQPFLFYVNNDPPLSSINNRISLSNLCTGTYYIRAEDTSGNNYVTIVEVDCDNVNSLLNCFPTRNIDLGPDGIAMITPNFLSGSQVYNDPNFLLINTAGNVSSNIIFTCDDLGYHQLAVLARDSFNRWDTCQVLVQINDSLNRCNGGGYVFQNTMSPATNCDTCTASYTFQGVNLVANNQQILAPYAFLWNDGDTTPNRNDLCPRRDYTLTVFDRNGNAYIHTIQPSCPLTILAGNCYDPSIRDTVVNYSTVYAPVCGCDQITYNNAAEAELKYGIGQWTAGACLDNGRTLRLTSSVVPSSFGCDTSITNCNGSIFINVSGGVAPYSISWAGSITTGFNPTGLCAGSYSATISDNNNNIIHRSFIVGFDGCVWPGDTDDNTAVNNFDLLPIGLTYNSTGFSRSTIATSWQGYTSDLWATPNAITSLPDYRHIDCDGNGVIDSIDVDAIVINYGQSYVRSSGPSLQGNIPFFVTSSSASPGDTIELDVHLGDSRFQAVDAYGVAFTIQYDPSVMDSASTSISFNNSWLGSDLLVVQKNFGNDGNLEVAVTRKDKNPITGAGVFGRVSFTIRDDLIMGKATSTDTTVSTPVTIGDVRLIDERNQEIGTNRTTGIVTLTPKTNINKLPFLEDGVYVFPNPVRKQLHISSETFAIENIQLWSATGQLLKQKVASNGWNQSLIVDQLPVGVYVLKVQTNGGVYTQKVTILK